MAFTQQKFDAKKYVDDQMRVLDEKGMRRMVAEFSDFRRVSLEEMRKSVYVNYAAFIRTSKEISEFEVELQQMKHLLSLQSTLIHNLAVESGVAADQSECSVEVAGPSRGDAAPMPRVEGISPSGGRGAEARASADGWREGEGREEEERGLEEDAEEEEERVLEEEAVGEEWEPTEIEKYADALPDILDILIAERKVDRAIELIDQGRQIVGLASQDEPENKKQGRRRRRRRGRRRGGYEEEDEEEEILSPEAALALEAAIDERRLWLIAQLEDAAKQPSARGLELRHSVTSLFLLGEAERGHQLLLSAHSARIRVACRGLKPAGTSFGGAYTAALAQAVFSSIGQAVVDSTAVIAEVEGEEQKQDPSLQQLDALPGASYASLSADLTLWAHNETQLASRLLQRHVLSSAAAAGGLHAAAECVRIAHGHCELLEQKVGMRLSPVLSRLLRPSVEEALEFNILRIQDSVAVMAAIDDWRLVPLPPSPRLRALQQALGGGGGGAGGSGGSHVRLSASAQRFYLMLVDLVEDLLPVISLQLFGKTLDRLAQLFETYVRLLQRALPGAAAAAAGGGDRGEDEGEDAAAGAGIADTAVSSAEEEEQQLALLGNASTLADDLLPRLALRLTLATDEVTEREGVGSGFGSSREDDSSVSSSSGRGWMTNGSSMTTGSSAGGNLYGSTPRAGGGGWGGGFDSNSGGGRLIRQGSSAVRVAAEGALARAAQSGGLRKGGGGVAVTRSLGEQKEWRRRLQKSVDKLRDMLCSCLVADFMFGDDGQPILTANEYLELDSRMRPSQWMLNPRPSPPFQALFMALNGISSTSSRVLGGNRDRTVTLLLMRLAEWLMMGLMVYSTFWSDLEDSEFALGATGLQQLVFDMYFVMQFAKSGKFSSRAMRKVCEDSATKSIVLFTESTGGDPSSLLQEDWWYEHKCQESCEHLLQAAAQAAADAAAEEAAIAVAAAEASIAGSEIGGEVEPASPTGSQRSTQSMFSVRSMQSVQSVQSFWSSKQ